MSIYSTYYKKRGFTQSLENGIAQKRNFKKMPFFSAGFTLVELIVVISIAAVVMTTLVFQNRKWDDQLSVNTQTYNIALLIRQAQIYALGVRENAQPNLNDNFNVGYGVYFVQNGNLSLQGAAFFVDINNNKRVDNGEIQDYIFLDRGVTISKICGASICSNYTGQSMIANISFYRPETKANILLLNNVNAQIDNPPVTIYFVSPQGRQSSIKVDSNGQVSITQAQ